MHIQRVATENVQVAVFEVDTDETMIDEGAGQAGSGGEEFTPTHAQVTWRCDVEGEVTVSVSVVNLATRRRWGRNLATIGEVPDAPPWVQDLVRYAAPEWAR